MTPTLTAVGHRSGICPVCRRPGTQQTKFHQSVPAGFTAREVKDTLAREVGVWTAEPFTHFRCTDGFWPLILILISVAALTALGAYGVTG